MTIEKSEFAEYINSFRLRELFINMGWDNDRTAVPAMEINNTLLSPRIVADKNGFKIIECVSDTVPTYPERMQAANKIKKLFHEHLIIFYDIGKTEQVWLYCYNLNSQNRKAGLRFSVGQDVERLYQRASGLIFELDEQDTITIVDVTARVRGNFAANAETVTRRFYDTFKKQHTMFLSFIEGIEAKVDKEWYASIMLNRLMFCYFMQRRGFLNQDRNYLRTKFNESKERLGTGKFYSFYRSFLLTLFHSGFGAPEHPPEIREMIGEIPYLNGGIFDLHELEQKNPDINISDEAFESIFELFDRYEWHLDTRDCAIGNEINPDVLGYIFEKYINDRSSMGAYYTKEDITGYISRSTILPWLLENTKRAYPQAFMPEGVVWSFLKGSGDEYIFDSVKHGAHLPLPEYIEIGVDTSKPDLINRRKRWNEPAPSEYALPTEIWREVVERRTRYEKVQGLITSGGITETADLITYNLDIVNFVITLLETIEDPKFIRIFYEGLEKITILDPTCGSGAFLFAALNILEPLYNSCLSRMDDYLNHDYKGIMDRSIRRFFDEKLEMMEHSFRPNKQYFVYKSIILNNLYGVDIMREAVETAKLRLFLKLVSTVDPDYSRDDIGIEPLPDIDFNIKAGNTLIGYANKEEVDDALSHDMFAAQMSGETKEKMLQMALATAKFKQFQLGAGDCSAGSNEDFRTSKADLSNRQAELKETLDALLRKWDYTDVSEEDWEANYMPFHWVSEFYTIIVENGGFDVIIGNPPYVGYTRKNKRTKKAVVDYYNVIDYKTLSTSNLYSFVIERSHYLANTNAKISMIIPISAFSTNRMTELMNFFFGNLGDVYISSFHQRPAQLFDGVLQRLCIFVATNSRSEHLFTSGVYRWNAESRDSLFDKISYQANYMSGNEYVRKLGTYIETSILSKYDVNTQIAEYLQECNHKNSIFYRTAGGGYWVTFLNGEFDSNSLSNKKASFKNTTNAKVFSAILNSNLFWWYYSVNYDLFNFKDYMIFGFRFTVDKTFESLLIKLSEKMEKCLLDNANYYKIQSQTRGDNETVTYKKDMSKPIMDEIDTILAQHYGFTEEELDYIINYDIKYRMGISGGSGSEDADDE